MQFLVKGILSHPSRAQQLPICVKLPFDKALGILLGGGSGELKPHTRGRLLILQDPLSLSVYVYIFNSW